MLVRKQKHRVDDQLQILNQLAKLELSVQFNQNKKLPNQTHLDDILATTHKMMSDTKNELIIEIQVLLILTIIQGLNLHQALNLILAEWKHLELISYQGTHINILSKNDYCDSLINSLARNTNEDKVFKILDNKNALECLNLYLVMNGFEFVLTSDSLELSFGRFHYLRNGRIRGVREFLKDYFLCESHLELLVKLRLIDSVHYNTMLRN
ncbi:MAG: hypothetical protein NXI20_03395 [bacterium]|nr:hypothetical protein [bacterium]